MSEPGASDPASRALGGAPRASAEPAARRPLLDGFRGLAIVLVIVHHALAGPDDPTSSLFERAAVAIARSSWIGVDCFFVLSGFLITGILIDGRERPHALRNFLARRALRTFPLYYAVLFVCFVVLPPILGPGFLSSLSTRQPWFWLHASNFYTILHNVLAADGPPVGWMSTFWSLSVEEHFYLAWALIAMAASPPNVRARLGVIGVVGFVATLGLRVVLAMSPYSGAIYYFTFTRLDALLLGALLAVATRRPGGLARFFRAAPFALVASFIAFAGIADASFLGRTLRFSAGALLFASLFVLTLKAEAERGSLLHRALSARWLRACGRYSYAMYIFNKPILSGISAFLVWIRLPLEIGFGLTLVVYVLLALVLSFAAAFVSFHVFERHVLALKARFT